MTTKILSNIPVVGLNNINKSSKLNKVNDNQSSQQPIISSTSSSLPVSQVLNSLSLKFQLLSPKERVWKDTAQETLNFLNDLSLNVKSDKKLAAKNLTASGLNETLKLDPTNKQHVKVVEKLEKILGGDVQEIVNPDNPKTKMSITNGLSIAGLNKGKNLEKLKTTLSTMIEATNYKPTKMNMGNYNLFVNNKELVQDLKPKYTLENFNKLVDKLETKHVFDLAIHPTLGIAKTAGTDVSENFEMGGAYWVTDSCYNTKLMKTRGAETAAKVPLVVNTIARFYKENEPAIQNLIDHPEIATMMKEGKFEEVKDKGIPHIFILNESKEGIKLNPHPDFIRWRQESHGNALKLIVSGVKDGLIYNKPYGLKPNEINENVVDSIANLTSYFKTIDYPTVPSVGNWEETPFKNGLTSDTAIIADALKSVKDLMFNPQYNNNPEILKVRERIVNSKNGKILKDTSAIDLAIKAGEERVKTTYEAEAPGFRVADASQIFTVKIAKFDENPVESTKKALKVLQNIEDKLAGDFGIIRYEVTKVPQRDGTVEHSSDAYLGLNFCVAADKKGNINLGYSQAKDKITSIDCSTPELFSAKAKLCGGDKEELAQWFFDPSMSTAYNKLRKDLVNYKKENNSTPEIDEMIKFCFEKQTQYMNRSLSRITGTKTNGEAVAKANGVKCPEWAIPEAYMKVSTFKSNNPQQLNDKTKQGQFVPGLNTPLAWAQTEQYEACEAYKEALKEQEKGK